MENPGDFSGGENLGERAEIDRMLEVFAQKKEEHGRGLDDENVVRAALAQAEAEEGAVRRRFGVSPAATSVRRAPRAPGANLRDAA